MPEFRVVPDSEEIGRPEPLLRLRTSHIAHRTRAQRAPSPLPHPVQSRAQQAVERDLQVTTQQGDADDGARGEGHGSARAVDQPVDGEEEKRQPAGHAQERGQFQPCDGEAGKHVGGAGRKRRGPRRAQSPQPEEGERSRQREVEPGDECHGARHREPER